MTGIRAAGMRWCFIWEPCSVWKWGACGCVCSTAPPTVGFLGLWHTPHYITLPLYGPQASASCRGGCQQLPSIPKYAQRTRPTPRGAHRRPRVSNEGMDLHPWLGWSAHTYATHRSADVAWPCSGFGYNSHSPRWILARRRLQSPNRNESTTTTLKMDDKP